MAKLSKAQWEEVSTLYRTGTPMSLITKTYSIARQTVHDRAKRYGWARDLAADVDLATGEKLTGLTAAASPSGGGDIALARRGFIALESSPLPLTGVRPRRAGAASRPW